MAYFVPPSRYSVLVVTDSRAADIKRWSTDWGDLELDVIPAPSAGIEAGVELLITERRDVKSDLVIVLSGICDVLTKNRTTHKYFMVHETVQDVVQYYMKQVKRGQELLEIFFDDAKWMFNPLTGADIYDYNSPIRKQLSGDDLMAYHCAKTPDPLQDTLNQAVLEINTEITKVNKVNNVFTPYTATYVHRHYGGAYHHSYQYTNDGCHLTWGAKQYWAKQIKKAIEKTRAMTGQ